MRRWIGRMACGAFVVGGLLTCAAALQLGFGVPTALARGLVVGLVVYMLLALGARAAGIRVRSATPPATSEPAPGRPTTSSGDSVL